MATTPQSPSPTPPHLPPSSSSADVSSGASTALIPAPQELALPSAKGLPSLNIRAVDRKRWLLAAQGMTAEEIAARSNVSILTVKDSLARMGMWLQANSHQVVDARVNEMALKKLEQIEEMFTEAMGAVRQIHWEEEGQVVTKTVRDFDTALKAARMLKEYIREVRPKGGGVAVQFNSQTVNNNNGGTGNINGAPHSFEEKLRKVREKNGLKNEEVIRTITAEELVQGNDYDESADDFAEDVVDGEIVDEGDEGEGEETEEGEGTA